MSKPLQNQIESDDRFPCSDYIISCVVDSQLKFQMQAQNLVSTLMELAGVPGSSIIVHTPGQLDPALAAWFHDRGIVVCAIQPFGGHAYCNKLAQLAALVTVDRPFVVLMDCDTVAAGPIRWPKPQLLCAKRVDIATPPQRVLSRIFSAAHLGEPGWMESDFPAGEGLTDRNNCNGGVYVGERSFLAELAPVWMKWARWCIENESLFGPHSRHIDQVSLALAARDLHIDIEPLPRTYNMPTHLGVPAEYDVDPLVLHYHGHVDNQLLLRETGLPKTDAAIARVNECLLSMRRKAFLNSVFFGARYELFPEIGAGAGSQGEHLDYKRKLLRALVGDCAQSVLDIGCGDISVSGALPVTRYLGVDVAAPAIAAARRLRPDWEFISGDAAELELPPKDVVLCFDVLIHQPTYTQYRNLAERLCALALDTVIVGAYDCPPAFTSGITFYYERITKTIAECGDFAEISVVGKYRDVSVVAARRRRSSSHGRDLSSVQFNLMSMVTDYPLLLRVLVDTARAKIGFFPAHTPRALEYPWILSKLRPSLEGKTVLDVGAGVNPLPLALAESGAAVVTIDSDGEVRNVSQRADWNEWGFLDYSQLDSRIVSVQAAYENWTTGKLFDCIYSVSVIEHLPAEIRRLWIGKFAAELNSCGLLLLTVDLIPETNRLWNLAAGRIVEPEDAHGALGILLEELAGAGFTVEEHFTKRNIPESLVDIGFIRATRALRASTVSSGLAYGSDAALCNVDRINKVCQPTATAKVQAVAGEVLTIEGWAVDGKSKAMASAVEIVVDGVPYEARYGLNRQDVAKYFHQPGYVNSGFELTLPGTLFAAGQHDLRIRVVSSGKDTYWDSPAFLVRCAPAVHQ